MLLALLAVGRVLVDLHLEDGCGCWLFVPAYFTACCTRREQKATNECYLLRLDYSPRLELECLEDERLCPFAFLDLPGALVSGRGS